MGITARQDLLVLGLSIIYIGGIVGGIFGWGIADGWSAETPMEWPDSNRFWPKPGTNGTHATNCTFDPQYDAPIRKLEVGCYSQWYYWQLPYDEATPVTRSVVWILYVLHQLLHWAFIWYAQEHKRTVLASKEASKENFYTGTMRWYNWALIAVTYLFHIAHLVQTHTTYDATAKDVVIQSSQASVIMMLVFVMLIEYRDRGMIMGWPNASSDDMIGKRLRLASGPIEYVRKYHGYAFSWAVIYTFWYHPMENTFGHVMGFIHTFLVMIQGSLIYQKVHLNKYWRLLLESWVWFHGFSVAVMVAKGVWWEEMAPFMFGYGFGTLFFVTQIFGLPLWKNISPYWRILPPALWLLFAILVVVCVDVIENSYLTALIFIPAGQYGCAVAAWLIIWLFTWCIPRKLSTLGTIFQVVATCFIYSLFVVISFLFQLYGASVTVPFMAITYILVFIFIIGCILSWFCLPLPENLQQVGERIVCSKRKVSDPVENAESTSQTIT